MASIWIDWNSTVSAGVRATDRTEMLSGASTIESVSRPPGNATVRGCAAAARTWVTGDPHSVFTSAPSSGIGTRVPSAIGRTVMRTIARETSDTAISTGRPATMMSLACPRTMKGAAARPMPAADNCFSAWRRVTDLLMGAVYRQLNN